MATLATQSIVRAGLTATFSAAAGGGDQFTNTGYEFIEIVNGGGGSITLTIVTQNTSDGLAVTDRAVVVGAGARMQIGPFQPSIYNDANGFVQLTYSGVTSVTVAIMKLVTVPGQ